MEEGLKEIPEMEKEVEKVVDIRDVLFKFSGVKGSSVSETGVHAIHSLSD